MQNPPSARSIFDLKSLGGLSIKEYPERKSKLTPKCRHCQSYHHIANYCRAIWVHAKVCAKDHATAACPNKNNNGKNPIWFHCKGPHTSTYQDCPKAPQPPNVATQKPALRSANASYAQISRGPILRNSPLPILVPATPLGDAEMKTPRKQLFSTFCLNTIPQLTCQRNLPTFSQIQIKAQIFSTYLLEKSWLLPQNLGIPHGVTPIIIQYS